MIKLLLVEDDYLQMEWASDRLRDAFGAIEIETIRTESAFRSRVASLAADPVDLVVMDIMLPWAEPSPDMPSLPPDVVQDGFFNAGLRCHRLLQENQQTRSIPVILYTALEKSDMPDGVALVQKDADYSTLVDQIRVTLRMTRTG